ncbi:hypothetical protein GSB9_02051 [Flavobacteriaceae bacterium GSB9]|nr:hypothetical protein GSB9_02051 [Flavobacteriaceae bacterium GSB9]
MNIQDINDQLRLKQVELQIAKDYKERIRVQNQIKKLQFEKEIEIIKDKIKRISNI